MKVEKRVYKIFYKGKQFALPLSIVQGFSVCFGEKVLIRRKLNPKS